MSQYRNHAGCLLVLLCGCSAPQETPQTNVPGKHPSQTVQTDSSSVEVLPGTYTSKDGMFTVKIPELVAPGAKMEERQPDKTTRGVYFADDFGHVYYILQLDNRKAQLTLERYAGQFQTGKLLKEKQFIQTKRGRELRVTGIHEGASPITSRTEVQGRWVEKKASLIEAWSVFKSGDYFYRVVAGVTPLGSKPEATLIADAKARLEAFLDGLTINEQKL